MTLSIRSLLVTALAASLGIGGVALWVETRTAETMAGAAEEAAQYRLIGDEAGARAAEAVQAAAHDRIRRVNILAATGGGILLLVVFVSARTLVTTLDAASALAKAFGDGKFGRRLPLQGPRELRDLALAVNTAADAIADRDSSIAATLQESDRQREQFRSVIDAMSDGLLMYDARGRILLSNPRCAELLGFTKEDLRDRSALELQESLRQRCESPARYQEQLTRHFSETGVHCDILTLVSPVPRTVRRTSVPLLADGVPAGRVFTYTDVTAEATLDRMKSEFVSMASHELRTPLTSVHAALQLALSGSGPVMHSEDRELLSISLASTERLVRLVNDLLDLSKIEAGRMPMRITEMAAGEVVRKTLEALRPLAAASRVEIREVVEDELFVRGDADLLSRVITNLVSNGIKYSPAGTTVSVGTQPSAEGVLFFVDDEGPGIPPEDMANLFKPFSRVGQQEYDRETGTGLGLAISRAIVGQHEGRIWVEGRQGGGTRFAFTLPAEACRPQLRAAS